MWDATCPNTFALSDVMLATSEAGAVADRAEDRKRLKYADVLATRHFVSVAVETSGVFGQGTKSFIKELGCRLQVKNGEPQAHHHLLQRISVAMQRGSTSAVSGTVRTTDDNDNVYFYH